MKDDPLPTRATQPNRANSASIGAHTDFGGVTVLPGKEGLQVWDEKKEDWLAVPIALEDVYVVKLRGT